MRPLEFRAANDTGVEVLEESFDRLPFDRIECPDLVAIGEMWLSLPREKGETLPRWGSFDPSMIVRSLAKVCLLRVGDWRAGELEFSLYGGHPTERIGAGHPLVMQEMRKDSRRVNYEDIRVRAGRAIDNQAPQYARKTLSWDGCGDTQYQVMMLPFMPENGVRRVMQPISSEPRPY